MVSKERVVSLGARGLSLETVKTVGWLAVSGAWSGVRAVIRGPALGARTLPGISSAARADTGPAAAWPVSYEASWAEKTAKNRLKSVGF